MCRAGWGGAEVSDAPVMSWETALGTDDDVRLLGDGEAHGFSTDGTTGCVADAAAVRPGERQATGARCGGSLWRRCTL
ncbi:DUF4241 domain-containing protein [Streptomyces sp. NPDC057486]|uniref:DUF4241 domain-containing protein n=1 Tax=Streptomyces sp. NPDC057486 TaxID=3346145 RepID=UPI0036A95A83